MLMRRNLSDRACFPITSIVCRLHWLSKFAESAGWSLTEQSSQRDENCEPERCTASWKPELGHWEAGDGTYSLTRHRQWVFPSRNARRPAVTDGKRPRELHLALRCRRAPACCLNNSDILGAESRALASHVRIMDSLGRARTPRGLEWRGACGGRGLRGRTGRGPARARVRRARRELRRERNRARARRASRAARARRSAPLRPGALRWRATFPSCRLRVSSPRARHPAAHGAGTVTTMVLKCFVSVLVA